MPPSPALLPEPPSLDNTFGPWLVGTFIALLQVLLLGDAALFSDDCISPGICRLYGVVLNQAVIYYRTYTQDPNYLKYWVRNTDNSDLYCSYRPLQVATALSVPPSPPCRGAAASD